MRPSGRSPDALRAIALEPENATAHWNRGLARLLLGDFAGGWQDYAYRWQTGDFRSRRRGLPQAPWQGEALAGKRILLWAEQGIGDEIMFLGLLPELMAAGAMLAEQLLVSAKSPALVDR